MNRNRPLSEQDVIDGLRSLAALLPELAPQYVDVVREAGIRIQAARHRTSGLAVMAERMRDSLTPKEREILDKRMATEACKHCGRPRPGYIADPHCPKEGSHVYCEWVRPVRP